MKYASLSEESNLDLSKTVIVKHQISTRNNITNRLDWKFSYARHETSIMAREITSSFGVQSSIHFDKDNKKIYYHFLHLSSKWRDGGTW